MVREALKKLKGWMPSPTEIIWFLPLSSENIGGRGHSLRTWNEGQNWAKSE